MSLPPASAPQQLADEAASDPPSPEGLQQLADEAASDPPSPEGLPEHGMESEAEVERSEPLTVSARGGSKMSTESEELVPDAAMQARSADQAEQAGDVASGLAPSKSSRVAMFSQVGPVEVASVCRIGEKDYDHEDESMDWSFENVELEALEEYDENIEDEPEVVSDGQVDPALVFPRDSDFEPELGQDQLLQLDRKADDFELKRLLNMGVLLDPELLSHDHPGLTARKTLSTKMVRTWREKFQRDPETNVDIPVWVRRSR